MVCVNGRTVMIVDATTAYSSTSTVSGRYPSDYFGNNDAWDRAMRDIAALGRELKAFIRIISLIPSKGNPGILPPLHRLSPPIITAAPAPDDRRRSIRALYTVRSQRDP